MILKNKEFLYKEFLADGNVKLSNKSDTVEFVNYLFYMSYLIKDFNFKVEKRAANSYLISKF